MPVGLVSLHDSNEYAMVYMTLQSGKKVSTTFNHFMWVAVDGQSQLKEASQV